MARFWPGAAAGRHRRIVRGRRDRAYLEYLASLACCCAWGAVAVRLDGLSPDLPTLDLDGDSLFVAAQQHARKSASGPRGAWRIQHRQLARSDRGVGPAYDSDHR